MKIALANLWTRSTTAAIICGLLALSWGGIGLTLTPGVNHDEVMLNAPAREWQLYGQPALPLLSGIDPSYAKAYYWHPPGHILLVRMAYVLLGFSIFSTRLVSLLFGSMLAAALFSTAWEITRKLDASYAAVALFFSHSQCWWLPRSGRMDNAALFLGVAGVFLWIRQRNRPDWRTQVCSGLLIGLSSLFHVVGLYFSAAIFIAECLRLRHWSWHNACCLLVPACLPLTLWIVIAFATGHGDAWSRQFLGYQLLQRHSHAPLWLAPFAELTLFIKQSKWQPLFVCILPIAIITSWKSLGHETRDFLAGGAAGAFLLIAATLDKGSGAYPLYWYVWISLLACTGVPLLLKNRSIWIRLICWLAILSPFAWQGLNTGIAIYQHAGRNPARVEAFFVSHIPPDSIVLGPEDIWYGVQSAGAKLLVWEKPDPLRHDFYVTRWGEDSPPPLGFHKVAALPDIMRKVLGRYFSHTSNQ